MSPSAATHIPSTALAEQKAEAKASFQKKCGWRASTKKPLICIPGGVTAAAGGDILTAVLPGLIDLDIQVAVLGKGSKEHGEILSRAAALHPSNLVILPDQDAALHAMLLASDMALFAGQAKPELLQRCLAMQTVPVGIRQSLLEDYQPNAETGNAFLCTSVTQWQLFAAIVRALETFRFPYDWRTIRTHCAESAE